MLSYDTGGTEIRVRGRVGYVVAQSRFGDGGGKSDVALSLLASPKNISNRLATLLGGALFGRGLPSALAAAG